MVLYSPLVAYAFDKIGASYSACCDHFVDYEIN